MVPEVWEVDAPLMAECNPERADGARQSAFGVRSGVGKDSRYQAGMSEAAPKTRFSDYLLGGLVWAYMRIAGSTVRWRVEGAELIEPLLAGDKAMVVAVWHRNLILFPVLETRFIQKLPKRSHATVIIVSNSKHGNITNQASRMLGLHIVRGSTARKDRRKDKGGVAGARAALKALRQNAAVCMTIDGPRGPAEHVPVEPVKLAQQAGVPVVTLGLSSGGKQLNTWDRMLLPLPFSRGAIVFGAPIETDKSMDSEALRERIELQMKAVNARAGDVAGQRTELAAERSQDADSSAQQMETSRE